MSIAVIGDKVVFDRDQVVTSTQAGKNFGEMRKRARNRPQFVSDRNDGIDTVIIGYDEFEAMAVELERLREERLYCLAASRIANEPNDGAVPLDAVVDPAYFSQLVQEEHESAISDSELFE